MAYPTSVRLPDGLADRARRSGLNVSAITRIALESSLERLGEQPIKAEKEGGTRPAKPVTANTPTNGGKPDVSI